MQLYVADYLGDTQHLTTEQHGAYLLLLMTMWRQGGSLPSDEKILSRIARVSARRWHLVAPFVMPFFDVADGKITQRRLVEEYQKALSKREKRSAIGKLGGDAKALKSQDVAVAKATVLPEHLSEPEPDKKQDTPAPPIGEASPKGVKSKGCRVDGFVPDIGAAVELGMTSDQARFESEAFLDYWRGVPASKGLKSDWPATWRNRVRDLLKRNGAGGPHRGTTSHVSNRPTHKQTSDGISRAFANIAARRGEPFASFEDHSRPSPAADDVSDREITLVRGGDGDFRDDPQRPLRVVGSGRY